MKKLLIAIAAVMITAASYAQGQVNFNNRVTASGVNAPVTLSTGGGAGSLGGMKAQLFLVQGATLTALTPVTDFRQTSAATQPYINGITVVVPGIDIGGTATLRMRVYAGESYDASAIRGESNDVTVTLGGGTTTPPDLVGLQGFIVPVPEPSTIALGVLGLGALLIRRRK